MLAYIVKRILYFIPTIILVSMLAFGLGKLAESDNTESLLNLQGIDNTMANYSNSYKKIYTDNKLHLPNFYLSFKPNYVEHNINEVVDPLERGLVQSYTDKRYNTHFSMAILNILRKLKKEKLIDEKEYNTALIDEKGLYDIANKLNAQGYKTNISALLRSKPQHHHNFHFPTIKWSGFDNQYHHWVGAILKGEFGTSKLDGRATSTKIFIALRWTLLILVANIFLTLLLSIPYGLYTGLHTGGRFDRWTGNFLFGVYAMPSFWIATLLVLLFTTTEFGMKIFPSVGVWYGTSNTSFWSMLANKWTLLILPVGISVFKDIAYLGRMIRDTVATESQKQYATTALSKGVNAQQLAYKHILPNALGPAITLAVGAIPGALGGSLLMEVIFNIPGMGRLMYTSISNADWAVVFPILLLTALVTVFWYLAGDILIAWLNPKIKL